MQQRTYEELQAAVTKKGYNFFDTGAYNLNLIGERTTGRITNQFDDIFYIAYRLPPSPTGEGAGGEVQVFSIPWTTKPGLYGPGAIENPNPKGTAILVPGQYHGAWKYYETADAKYPFDGQYFQQIEPIKVWRDATKEISFNLIEGQFYGGIFGVNLHKMSNPGATGFPVNNWSEGCQGAPEPDFIKMLPLIHAAGDLYGYTFSYTLLETADFNN